MATAIIYKNLDYFGITGVKLDPPMEQSQFQVPVDSPSKKSLSVQECH